MPEQTDVFVSALAAHYGEQAYPRALEQLSRSADAGLVQSTLSWTNIPNRIASLRWKARFGMPAEMERNERYLCPADQAALRQLLYVSKATRLFDEDGLYEILRSSQDNNVLYGVTGMLWSDGQRFIQVLEGPSASVEEVYERLLHDVRHHSLMIVYDHLVDKRDFGGWSMCHRRSYETDDEYDQNIRRALAAAPASVRATLLAFIGGECRERNVRPTP